MRKGPCAWERDIAISDLVIEESVVMRYNVDEEGLSGENVGGTPVVSIIESERGFQPFALQIEIRK
jgi:hypothetical protein